MEAFYHRADGQIEPLSTSGQINDALNDKQGLIWLDFYDPTDQDFTLLEQVFGFHHLALEDCRKQSQRSKIEEYDTYFFIVVHAIKENKDITFETTEIDSFVGPNYLVSLHRRKFEPISRLIDNCHKNECRFLKKGSDFLLYSLFDAVVDTFFPHLERIDDQIDKLEDEVLANPSQAAINKIFRFKKELVFLRKLIGPQREIVNTLTSRDFINITEETIFYFRDIYDHLVRIYDMLDSYRDLMSGALDVYLGTINNQMNKIMQRLTIFAATFMPITFITGVFGMNFKFAPQEVYDVGYMFYIIMLIIAVTAGVNIWWFRRNKWF